MDVRSVLGDSFFGQEESLGDAEVCIAVLDGPVDLSHPCFEGADLTRIPTLVQGPAGPGPMSLHGTHVASLLFGQLRNPVVGVAPRCRGLILPVFQDGQDNRVSQLDLARAVERAVHEGAHVINISGGERVPNGKPDDILAHSLQLCENSGVLVVAAVGNDGCDCLQVPAAVPSVLAAGAAGANGEPLQINNWGAVYRENGVLAPGEDIEGAAPGRGRVAMTGSSFAAPSVSGVAALLVAAQIHQGSKADPLAARRAILETASTPPCSPSEAPECRRYLAGHLSAARAYQYLSQGDDTAVSDPRNPSPAAPPQPRVSVQLLSDTRVKAAGQPPLRSTSGGESNKGVSVMDTNHVHPGSPEYGATCEQPGPDPAHGSEAALGGRPPSGVQATAGWPGADSTPVLPAADCACGGGNPPGQPAYPQQSEPPKQPPEPATTVPAGPRAVVGTFPGVQAAADCACGGSGPPVHPTYTQLADVPQQPPEAPPPGGRLGSDREAGGVRPSCRCAGQDGNSSGPLVYAIGKIGWDFQTEAVRDAFRQQMDSFETETRDGQIIVTPGNPYDPIQLRAYLSANPEVCDKMTWVLMLDDSMVVYALKAETPVGMAWGSEIPTSEGKETAYADGEKLNNLLKALAYPPVSSVYRSFREAIVGQSLKTDQKDYVSRVSVAGALTGRTTQLFSGQKVPELEVESRALYTWNENALVEAIIKAVNTDTHARGVSIDDRILSTTIRSLLDGIYNQLRNLGQSSADRALNFVGTNAFQVGAEIAQGLLSAKHIPGPEDRLYALDTITVEKSPYSRQDSDCQDVKVRFFDPEDERHATLTLMFTVDVSRNPPVTVGTTKKFLGAM